MGLAESRMRNFVFSEHRAIGRTFTPQTRLTSGIADIVAADLFNATL
jgi:hypothetical protein